MESEVEQADKTNLLEFSEEISRVEFRDVTFRYGNRKPVLKNISFSVNSGEKIALVGSSGSGKSTIAKLLLKYYEVETGSIMINGEDINEYSNESVRNKISYVPQNIELFSKSIYENIRMSRPNATMDMVKEAARKAQAYDFIKQQPAQFFTYLEEAGNGLSGGEKQRIVLARALLRDANFYILDESTSSLDFVTENAIFDMIYNQLRNESMIIIAHRLATIKNCDRILVIKDGIIVEMGTHEELLALGETGEYYKMWQLQLGNFKIKEKEDTNIVNTYINGNEMSY